MGKILGVILAIMKKTYSIPVFDGCEFDLDPDGTPLIVCTYRYPDDTILTGYGIDNNSAYEDVLLQHRGLLALLNPPGFPASWHKKETP
jgi:hypothetical protein